ncbi:MULTISPECIES: DUF4377 domain-containing protein [unclassified Lysobacter]|uniref:DUF4377 domain-containing protein n=1 Tax=unclassified Lysobacter TaxID=2635362 RepID=UPI0006FAF571|nr:MULTISPECIES: DUF4377 domain-containing protein [unclassified Lysobacter]KRA20737.1 hypothetical protein ASD69_05370 [Lysobacter sp. Root604]KRD79770.1 hypothetical protein ASE43_02405 [Lysobacter sp. Root983]
MTRLIVAAAALLLSGCMSQILLDGSPAGTPNIAGDAVAKRIRAVASEACAGQLPALRYQVLEHGGDGWRPRCARVEGFAYTQGQDYVLEIIEYPAAQHSSLGRLVLKQVIGAYPHIHE